jgi:hypothetical protein
VQDRSGRMLTSAAGGSHSYRGRQLRPEETRRFNPGPLSSSCMLTYIFVFSTQKSMI